MAVPTTIAAIDGLLEENIQPLRRRILSCKTFWNLGLMFSTNCCLLTLLCTNAAEKYMLQPKSVKELSFLLLSFYLFIALTVCLSLFKRRDFPNIYQAPGPLLKTIGSAFVIALSVSVQYFQEISIVGILVNISLVSLVFITLGKFRPATDFGLFDYFMTRIITITFSVYGFKNGKARVISSFCVIVCAIFLSFKNWLEAEPESLEEMPVEQFCFMDVAIDGRPEARLVIRLYQKFAPTTVESFKTICNEGLYTGTCFTRIISGLEIITGVSEEINTNLNTGERNSLRDYRYGHLSTTGGRGPIFAINISSDAQFQGNRLIFGEVVYGLGFLKLLSNVETDRDGTLSKKIEIIGCGVLSGGEDKFNLLGKWCLYPDWVEDIRLRERKFCWWIGAVGHLQILGNIEMMGNNHRMAYAKFRQAQRYLEAAWSDGIDDKANDSVRHYYTNYFSGVIAVCLQKMEPQSNLEEESSEIESSEIETYVTGSSGEMEEGED